MWGPRTCSVVGRSRLLEVYRWVAGTNDSSIGREVTREGRMRRDCFRYLE